MSRTGTSTASPGRGGGETTRSRWTALAVLCTAELLVTTDNTVVNVALPSLSRQLSASTSQLQWTVDAYTLTFAGLLLAAGHVGDRFGRRRALLAGTAGFGIVSALAACSTSLGSVVAARALMGGFAALIFPATLAIIVTMFTTTKDRVAAVGIWSAVAGVSVALGPLVSGWLLELFSWQSVFWVNVAPAAVVVAAGARVVPESRGPRSGRFDLRGAGLSVAGLTALVWAVIEGPRQGWTSPACAVGFGLAACLLSAFVVVERRVAAPLVDLALFADRRFSAAAGAISVAFFGLFGFTFLITQYFQSVKGYSTLSAGVRTLPFALVLVVLAPFAVRLSSRAGTAVIVTSGLVLMAGGFALAGTAEVDSSYLGLILASMVLIAAGLALVSGPATESIMRSLPLHHAAAGSAVNNTTRELGGALGVAVLGSVMAAIYRERVTAALHAVPTPLKEEAARSLVAGLNASAHTRVPGAADAVREAFVAGLNAASWVAAATTVVAAVIAAFALPHRMSRPDSRPTDSSDVMPERLDTLRP